MKVLNSKYLGSTIFIATLGVLILLQSPQDARATPGIFDASTGFTLSSTAPGAPADVTADLDIPMGDLHFGELTTHFPPQSDLHDSIAPGAAPIIGDVVGTAVTAETLGLANFTCSAPAVVEWVFLNAVPDDAAGVVVADATPPAIAGGGAGRMQPFLADAGLALDGFPGVQSAAGNGLPAGVEEYPSFLETLFNVGGIPVYPDARYFAGVLVGGQALTLNLMLFGPGDLAVFAPTNPLWDVSATQFGYASVLVVNDPTDVASPTPVSDTCSPLGMETVYFGTTRANSCVPAGACAVGGTILQPCSVTAAGPAPICAGLPLGPGIRYENPGTLESGTCTLPECTRMFLSAHVSQHDLDGDTFENPFDTCPTVVTSPALWDPRDPLGDVVDDGDIDMLPGGGPAGGCDPTPAVDVGPANEDGDAWPINGDTWVNALDNCPLAPNGAQTESERTGPDWIARPEGGPRVDEMGDACDGAEAGASCANAVDDDADSLVNDGCPVVGAFAEDGCLNTVDDPDEDQLTPGAQNDDAVVNDGCESSALVSYADYWVTLSSTAVCFTFFPAIDDTDADGWCDGPTAMDVGGYPYTTPADPSDVSVAIVPEAYLGTFFPMPIAASGASGSPTPARQPLQACNDGIDNDGDTLVDLLDAAAGACRPPGTLVLRPADSDGDGYSDEAEIHIGTDVFGRCDVGAVPGISRDWPADLSDGGGVSRDEVDTVDLAVFVGGLRPLGKSPGGLGFDRRYDVVPGPGALSTWINTLDLVQVTTFVPPMFGVKAFGYLGTDCTPHPQYND